ncbi:MAG: GNAT family N-acetyltransferase, partial [Phormidium sp.]
MGFWKSWFSDFDNASSTGGKQVEEYPIAGTGESPNRNSRIFFSTDRDIDLYELEELCDAVGWSRRPLRKVKKALQHSFLVGSM